MENGKILINFSNHPSEKWDEAQKKDWKMIIDERFPRINPDASKSEIEKLVVQYRKRIEGLAVMGSGDTEVWLHLVGHWSFCYMFIARYGFPNINGLAVPMADRDFDARYQFVQWIYLGKEEIKYPQVSSQETLHS